MLKRKFGSKGSRKKVFLMAVPIRRGGGVNAVPLKKKELLFELLFSDDEVPLST